MTTTASERVSGGVTALRVCSGLATAVFVALAIAAEAIPHQADRLTLVGVFVVSALICGLVRRVAGSVDERTAEWLLLVLCLVPTVDALLGLAVLREAQVTDFLYLVFLVYGLLAMRWQTLVGLVVAGTAVWAAEMSWLGFPHHVVVHDLLQLLLRGVVAFAVFSIRSQLDGALRRTGRELDEQVTALSRTRELHGRELSRYRTVFEHGPLGIMVMDMDGVVVDANQAMEQILRVSREELLGHDAASFVHPDDRRVGEQARQMLESVRAAGATSMDRRFVRGDGKVIHGNITATAMTGPEGEPWILAHVDDVTQRREMERDLIRSRDGMRAVADISSATQRGIDPRPVAAAHLERLAGASQVSILEPVDETTLVVSYSAQPALVGVEMLLAERSASAHVWRSGEPLFLADAAASPLVNAEALGLSGMTSMLWHPVGAPGDPSAILCIGWPYTVEGVGAIERDAVRTLAAELGTALTSERLRRQLEERSRVDALTGLINRRGWDHGVTDLLNQSRRTGQPFVLAVADLDHFKQFNDEFGHLEGDILLSGFAANARAMMRDVDLLARWGGEEFAIALRDCDLSDALPVLERIRGAVPGGRTCSIGFATFHPSETLDACMRRADEAMYRAKANGRDRIEYGPYEAPAPSTAGSVRERRRVR